MRRLFALALMFFSGVFLQAEGPTHWLYVGTYTGAKSKGIYRATYDATTGKIGEPVLAADVRSPSFLAVDPTNNRLFSVGEIADFGSRRSGSVSSFAMDKTTGKLTPLSTVSSVGSGPCHLNVDKTGKFVVVANYGGGSTAVLPVREDGKLGEASSFIQHKGSSVNKSRQEGPHAHSANISPDNRFAIVADLGLDKLFVYKLDSKKGQISPNDQATHETAPGAGPRHFAFHPNGKYGYLLNELTMTLDALEFDADKGTFKQIASVNTKPDGPQNGESTAEVCVHPSGKFVYASNRGHHSISAFSIDQATGKHERIQVAQGGIKTPRNFVIDPSGRFLLVANQDSDSVISFAIDQTTGKLSPTDQSVTVGTPVCLRFVEIR
jgi:6-phosphogluconolactonase